nr:MAG TPA: hypothetical protein [Caudoviricetes sp.]
MRFKYMFLVVTKVKTRSLVRAKINNFVMAHMKWHQLRYDI